MKVPEQEWMRKIDDRLSGKGVPVKRRPWDAWSAWAQETGPSRLDGPDAKAIFSWYTDTYGSDRFAVGALYTGTFLFDETIWPVNVPICFGTVRLNLCRMLDGMSTLSKERLFRDGRAAGTFIAVAADCIDYALGVDDLRKESKLIPFAQDLIVSGDKELRSAVHILLSTAPSQKAAEAARMATEMFLKGYLAQNAGLSEQQARRELKHDLSEALRRCLELRPNSDLSALDGQLSNFPEVSSRYSARESSLNELWSAYGDAQFTGATILRLLTGRDVRGSLRVTQ